jgi:AraC-like DNA-binding protein
MNSLATANEAPVELATPVAARPWTSVRPADWLGDVRSLIDSTFRARPSVKSLAAAVGIHPDYLGIRFAHAFGVRVGEYVRLRRVAWSARVLADTDRSLFDVASAAGFYDQSHLTRSFTALVGLGPGRFQRCLHRDGSSAGGGAETRARRAPALPEDLVIARGWAYPVPGSELLAPHRPADNGTQPSRTIVLTRRDEAAAGRWPQRASALLTTRCVARVQVPGADSPSVDELDIETGLLSFLDHGRLVPCWRWPGEIDAVDEVSATDRT